MTVDPTGWSIEDFAAAYRSGVLVADVINATLTLLRVAPCGVLIGEPLVDHALADVARLEGRDPSSLPLFGVPFVVKDNIDIACLPTTAGWPGYTYIPTEDATVVALLRAAGAIAVGKTNLDQFATGLVGTRSPYGTPPNTIDVTLVPGGSSSGSAVAVGLGLVPFALGTDTAGSGRVPAALNGIVGLKPTVGSASTFGIVPAVRRLDCPSVLAQNVQDAAFVTKFIRQPDPRDPFMRTLQVRPVFHNIPIIGVPASWPDTITLSDDMSRWFADSIERLRDLGCEIRPVDINPLIKAGELLYGSSLVAERAAVVGDAIEKGGDGLDPVVTTIIGSGKDFTAIDAYRTEYELARLRSLAAPLWNEIDALALPTTQQLVSLDDVRNDPFGRNEMLGRLTTFVNVLNLMSIVVPMKSGDAPVPAGLQLVGQAWQDTEIERLGQGFETGKLSAVSQPCTLVVVGAHLSGLPLNHQLIERRATLVGQARTSPDYRLYALSGTVPPKPGLIRTQQGLGAEIDVEVWSMGFTEFGSFVDQVPAPLCIGTVQLSDGSVHKGFLCESSGLVDATDITSYAGWRSYLDR